jgi:hypothetical protein
MVMPSLAEIDHGIENFVDHLRIERRCRLVEQHDLGVHAQRARDRYTLLLAARELGRVFFRLLRNADPLEIPARRRLRHRPSMHPAP